MGDSKAFKISHFVTFSSDAPEVTSDICEVIIVSQLGSLSRMKHLSSIPDLYIE